MLRTKSLVRLVLEQTAGCKCVVRALEHAILGLFWMVEVGAPLMAVGLVLAHQL